MSVLREELIGNPQVTLYFLEHAFMLSCFSRVQLFATTCTAAHQAPPSMGFSSQEYQSRVPLPSLRKEA